MESLFLKPMHNMSRTFFNFAYYCLLALMIQMPFVLSSQMPDDDSLYGDYFYTLDPVVDNVMGIDTNGFEPCANTTDPVQQFVVDSTDSPFIDGPYMHAHYASGGMPNQHVQVGTLEPLASGEISILSLARLWGLTLDIMYGKYLCERNADISFDKFCKIKWWLLLHPPVNGFKSGFSLVGILRERYRHRFFSETTDQATIISFARSTLTLPSLVLNSSFEDQPGKENYECFHDRLEAYQMWKTATEKLDC